MARSTAFYIRFPTSIILLALIISGLFYLNSMSNGDALSEPSHLDFFIQHILSDTYVERYVSYGAVNAYALIEAETVRKIVRPFADSMTYALALVAVGTALWLAYARFLAKPRQPSEVAKSLGVWLLLLVLTLSAAAVPGFILLEPAISLIEPLIHVLTLVLVGVVAALLFVAWTYLLTPSLLRPALPMAWRLGR